MPPMPPLASTPPVESRHVTHRFAEAWPIRYRFAFAAYYLTFDTDSSFTAFTVIDRRMIIRPRRAAEEAYLAAGRLYATRLYRA